MSYEEKLNHLEDWMDIYINFKLEKYRSFALLWEMFNECGILLSGTLRENHPPNFENYLKMIEEQKVKRSVARKAQ